MPKKKMDETYSFVSYNRRLEIKVLKQMFFLFVSDGFFMFIFRSISLLITSCK
jgi:hypothetical protein